MKKEIIIKKALRERQFPREKKKNKKKSNSSILLHAP